MRKNFNYQVRKWHRYLGLFIGIQFIAWTFSGLYFSWSNMDEVHGDHDRKHTSLLSADLNLVSPSEVIENIRKQNAIDSIRSVSLIQIMGQPYYQVRYSMKGGEHAGHHNHTQLADAGTGALRGPLTQNEAVAVAQYHFTGTAPVSKVELIEETNGHHEYRGSPLPAYAIYFDNESNTCAYVAAELGTVQKFRNTPWRRFDFLWMLHTMDYTGRDNISNWILRIFSVLGLVTILSGFALYYVSSPTLRKIKKKASRKHQPL
jgi:uncharacterized protein YpmB